MRYIDRKERAHFAANKSYADFIRTEVNTPTLMSGALIPVLSYIRIVIYDGILFNNDDAVGHHIVIGFTVRKRRAASY